VRSVTLYSSQLDFLENVFVIYFLSSFYPNDDC
jgi:hypothetical protein